MMCVNVYNKMPANDATIMSYVERAARVMFMHRQMCAPKIWNIDERNAVVVSRIAICHLLNSRDETIDGNRCEGKVFSCEKEKKTFAKSAYRRSSSVG